MKDLDELLKLKAAAHGRFYLEGAVLHAMSGRVAYVYPHNPYSAENAAYITAACNAVPELVARVRELERQREFFLSTLKENNLCPAKGRCWPDGSELEEWDCSAANNRECWIQAAKEANDA